jgi:sugar (pentulose or hexulose) kinase
LPATPLCTLAKYAWMRAHWPASRRGVRWMNIAEWIVRELGGDARTEASLASQTGFYDLH